VAEVIPVFAPWNHLHRESFAVLPVGSAAGLAERLGLQPEELYTHSDGTLCLLLPTRVAAYSRGEMLRPKTRSELEAIVAKGPRPDRRSVKAGTRGAGLLGAAAATVPPPPSPDPTP
jgi:hypothetical protein